MEILKKYFPSVQTENELNYFAQIEGVLSSVDELSSVQITKTTDSYAFRIAPSHPKYINIIIEELITYHNLFGIRLDFSKSIKTTCLINFNINLFN